MQRFSIFHASSEQTLKAWHRPYAEVLACYAPVLDIGCGPGYFADLLRDHGAKCVGLDIDPAMVEASRSRGHVAHQGNQCSIHRLGIEFGAIHVSHVIEHLWGEEVVALLEQCAANLCEGGRLVIRTPNWEMAEVRRRVFWLDHTHRRPYGRELIERLLRDLGFTVEISGYEPYGLRDLFVIGVKGCPNAGDIQLSFSKWPAPFPTPLVSKSVALLWRAPSWLKRLLRPLRSLSK